MINRCLFLPLAALLLLAAGIRADDTTRSLNAGLTLTDGNSETLLGHVGLLFEGERAALGEVRAGVDYRYGEARIKGEKDTTVNQVKAQANTRKTMSARSFAYLDGSFTHDDVARLSYRFTVGPGVGGYALKTDVKRLSAEVGPSYVWEKTGDGQDDFFAIRFAQRFSWTLSESARFWQAAEYLPEADDFGRYLFNAEAGIEAAMTERVNLRLVLQNAYDSHPGTGLEQNDLTLIAGLGVQL